MKIKFSHEYPKLYYQTSARLLAIEIRDRAILTDKFIEYDTRYYYYGNGAYYELPKDKILVLVFLGNELIPFTTVRRWTPEKEKYYTENIGKSFTVEMGAK